MTTLALLEGMRRVLETPDKWTRQVYSKDSRGYNVEPTDKEAVCFCLQGAALSLRKVLNWYTYRHAIFTLQKEFNAWLGQEEDSLHAGKGWYIANWNDAKDRTYEEVIAFLDARIAFHRGQW